jgi:hypothetical protein
LGGPQLGGARDRHKMGSRAEARETQKQKKEKEKKKKREKRGSAAS